MYELNEKNMTMKKFLFVKKMCVVLCMFYFAIPVFSQEQADEQSSISGKILMDPKLRYGKLDNGLTYYIRHNEVPKERAEFYIVNNVGSMQEEINQRGLAHFLEHMAFNGSKNFPSKKGIQDYTESIGMRMGENLNAYTSFDETVYMLMNVPVTREGIIDSCLLILHDWSSFLLLEDEAIEKERGVIREEWRTNNTAQMRLWEQQLPKMFPENKYGTRLPIGSIDVINNFKRNDLVAYYKKWYRPDLQAIIIVGDIDVDKVEEKIKKTFSDIPMPINPAKREASVVPDNTTPLASIASDKEMPYTLLEIYYKHRKTPELLKGTIPDFMTSATQKIIALIMSERFSEIIQKPGCPLMQASVYDGDFFITKTKDAWTSQAVVKPGELENAIMLLAYETERVKKFGFTEEEYERAKANLLKSYDSEYKEREKKENSYYAEKYVSNFTEKEPVPGIEVEYELIKGIMSELLSLEGVNNYVKSLFNENKEHNLVMSLSGPDKEDVKYPKESELLAFYLISGDEEISQKVEEEISKILIPELPEPGKIVSEKEDPLFGATIYTLSNGIRVAVKETDFKEDEIKMTAMSPGGISMFKDPKDTWNLKIINNVIAFSGLGEFSFNNLGKALAGKKVSCQAGLDVYMELIKGTASPSDLKTLFELVYLSFTNLRTDEDVYAAFVESAKPQLDNRRLNPREIRQDTLNALIYDNNPREIMMKSSDFDKVDYHRIIEMYKERFADASDFVFTFIGNVDKDSIRPLMEQYLATLPSLNRKEKADERQVTPFHKGKIKVHVPQKLETPKSSVNLFYSGKMPYNLKNIVMVQFLNQILDMVYEEKVREEESASYGVQCYMQLLHFPEGRTSIQINFDTDPEKQDGIIEIIKSELQQIADKGPSQADIDKVRNIILTGRSKNILQSNDYWLGIISSYYYRNFNGHTDYEKILNSIKAGDLKSFMKQFLNQGNEIEVVMYPAE